MKKMKESIGIFLIVAVILSVSGCVENESLKTWNDQTKIANDYALKGTDYITQAENKIDNKDYEESLSLLDNGIEQLNLSISAGEKALSYAGDTGMDFLTEYKNAYINNKKELKEYAENLKNYAMVMILIENGKNVGDKLNETGNFISTAENTEDYSKARENFQNAKNNVPEIKQSIETMIKYGTLMELDVYVQYIGKISTLVDKLEEVCDEGIGWAEANMNNDQEQVTAHLQAYGNLAADINQIAGELSQMQIQYPYLQGKKGEYTLNILADLRDEYKSAYEDHINKAIEYKNKMEEIEKAHPDKIKKQEE